MKIKGTAVKSTQEFVKIKFPDRYNEWLESLPEESRIIYKDVVLSGNWYDLVDSILKPTKKIAELFYDSETNKLAYSIGKESALQALSGIYKIFVKIASVDFVLKKVKSIFTTYYSSGKFELIKNNKKLISFRITGFKEEEKLIFERIAGWIDGIFEVIAYKEKKVNYTITKKDGDFLEVILNVTFAE